MYLNISCNSSLWLPQHEINSYLYPWIISGFFWPETKMVLETEWDRGTQTYNAARLETILHQLWDRSLHGMPHHIWPFQCSPTDSCTAVYSLHAVRALWKSEQCLGQCQCNFCKLNGNGKVLVQGCSTSTWCFSWWRDGRMPIILHNWEVCAVWWFVQSPEALLHFTAIFVSLVFVTASHQ